MLSRIFTSAALMAGLATASYNVVINNTHKPIKYGFTGINDAQLGSGTIAPNGGSAQFALGESRNVKMCFDCANPGGASSGIYQFEQNYDPSSNRISYDWSAVNGDPFTEYHREIRPSNPNCRTIICNLGDASNDCQYTTPTNYDPADCVAGGNPPLVASIGLPPSSKARRHAKEFSA